jgi:hypothetical protein
MLKLIILAVIVIRYKVSKHFNRPVFMFKGLIVLLGLFILLITVVWPEAVYSLARQAFDSIFQLI